MFGEYMSTIGEAIKSERLRLGMSQEEFGAAGGVKKRTQISYEQDERSPDAIYLRAISAIGVDVQFILTGDQATASLTQDEKELLSGYRGLDIRGKAGVLGMIDGMASPLGGVGLSRNVQHEQSRYAINPVFKGDVGQTIYGDVTSPNTVNMPQKGKKK